MENNQEIRQRPPNRKGLSAVEQVEQILGRTNMTK